MQGTVTHSSSRWEAQVESFLRQKIAQTTVGTGWIRRMRWELLRVPKLLERVGAQPVPLTVSSLKPEHIVAMRKRMDWEKATFSIHFVALRQFAKWGKNTVANLPGLWRLPSGSPGHRRWLTKDQLSQLLAAARGPEKLLVALEGLNGLRRIEVLRLRRKDVLLDEGCIRVLGKGRDGGKWRKIPMHPLVRDLIGPILRQRLTEERLFAVSASTADQLLHRAAERANFAGQPGRISHHDLRRTFGRIAHDSGMDLIQLKNLLGHASVEMTVHYIGLDADKMREGLELIRL
jgi:integrase